VAFYDLTKPVAGGCVVLDKQNVWLSIHLDAFLGWVIAILNPLVKLKYATRRGSPNAVQHIMTIDIKYKL
jgi:hypothetical protein